MNILVLGANGKVGSLVVKELSKTEYSISAFIHGKNLLPEYKNVTFFQGDIYNPESLRQALKDIDIVISCLGSWGTKRKDVLSVAMKNIIPLMESTGCNRIISLTGSEAQVKEEKIGIIQRLTHPIFKLLAGKILFDGEEHLRLLQSSNLNWTVVRSPVMNNVGKPGKFQLKNKYPLPFRTINRHSVAISLVNQIEDEVFINSAPYIFRK